MHHEIEEKVRALQRSEQRYLLLLSAPTNVIWFADPAGNFIEPQESWTRFTGQVWEEHRDLGWLKMIYQEDKEINGDQLCSYFHNKQPFEKELMVWNQNFKSYHYCLLQGVPQKIGDQVVEWVGMFTDIHNQKIAEGKFRIAVEAAPNAMVMTDGDGNILLVNSEAENLFEFTRDELVGRPIETLVPERFRENHPNYRADYLVEPKKRSMGEGRELYAVTKSGREVPVEIGLNPIRVGSQTFVMSSILDITELKAIMELQKRHARDLERSNRELDQFAHIASHDLKAPLRAIKNLATWISEDSESILPLESKKHLQQMQHRVGRMERLLDDLLAYSRAGRKKEEVCTVNLAELIGEIIEMLDPPPSITIMVAPGLPTVRTQKIPLEQIIRNLVSNSIKHHDKPKGLISLSAKQQGGFIEVVVSDDGPGIEAQNHAKIFEMFKTLRPRDEVEGSGIGLAIVKKLVEYAGGSVSVESDGVSGTTFRFSWPIQ